MGDPDSPKPPRPAPPGGELSGLLRRAEALQRELDKAQAALKDEAVEGADAAGRVWLRLGGEGNPLGVRIHHPGLADADRRQLEEALAVALRTGLERLFALRRQRLSAVTRGLNLPGLFG